MCGLVVEGYLNAKEVLKEALLTKKFFAVTVVSLARCSAPKQQPRGHITLLAAHRAHAEDQFGAVLLVQCLFDFEGMLTTRVYPSLMGKGPRGGLHASLGAVQSSHFVQALGHPLSSTGVSVTLECLK